MTRLAYREIVLGVPTQGSKMVVNKDFVDSLKEAPYDFLCCFATPAPLSAYPVAIITSPDERAGKTGYVDVMEVQRRINEEWFGCFDVCVGELAFGLLLSGASEEQTRKMVSDALTWWKYDNVAEGTEWAMKYAKELLKKMRAERQREKTSTRGKPRKKHN